MVKAAPYSTEDDSMAALRQLSEAERLRLVIETQHRTNSVTLDQDQVMRVVTSRAQAITEADGAVVELVEDDEMVYRAATGSAAGSIGMRLSRATSLSGLCVSEGAALRCDDSETDPRVDRAACVRIGLRSMITVPLLHGPEPIGVLKVISAHPGQFDDCDIEVLRLLGRFIGDALANASSHGRRNHQALHDGLTGLPNRHLFMERLDRALRRSGRTGGELAVIFVDLDGFKAINDTAGHAAGDAALRAVADRLAATLRAGETLARFGGDEFVLLCENIDDEATEAVIRRVTAAVEGTVDGPARLGASIGVGRARAGALSSEEILSAADAAMYRSKRGRSGSADRPSGAPPP